MRGTIIGLFTLGMSLMANAECLPLYQHQFKTLQGETVDFCQFQDRKMAEKCNQTCQFY